MNNKKVKLSKNDNKLLEIAKSVSDNSNEIEIILIGGRALNLLVDEVRYSSDNDLGVRNEDGSEISKTQFIKFSKKVIKEIEKNLNIKIERITNTEDEMSLRFECKSYYKPYPFLFKIFVFVDGEYSILELSKDETIDSMQPWNTSLGIKIAPIEFILGIKTIILAKRISNSTIFENSNYRHIYDICRIIKMKNFKTKKLIAEMHKIHNYENVRQVNNKSKDIYEIDFKNIFNIIIDWLNIEIEVSELDKNGKLINLKSNYEKIMFLNEKTYVNKFDDKDKENILSFLINLNEIFLKNF